MKTTEGFWVDMMPPVDLRVRIGERFSCGNAQNHPQLVAAPELANDDRAVRKICVPYAQGYGVED
jgi:hypothetical protein